MRVLLAAGKLVSGLRLSQGATTAHTRTPRTPSDPTPPPCSPPQTHNPQPPNKETNEKAHTPESTLPKHHKTSTDLPSGHANRLRDATSGETEAGEREKKKKEISQRDRQKFRRGWLESGGMRQELWRFGRQFNFFVFFRKQAWERWTSAFRSHTQSTRASLLHFFFDLGEVGCATNSPQVLL